MARPALVSCLKQHQSAVAGTVLSGGKLFVEILAGVVLTLFVTFFGDGWRRGSAGSSAPGGVGSPA